MLSYKKYIRTLAAATAMLLTTGLTSCSGIFDDLEECPRGVTMRFIFDYNLEFANAFPNQVDCLSVWIFDKEGNRLQRVVETSKVLADEDWRLTIDLPAGEYRAVAYGGLDCDMASFSHTANHETIHSLSDLQVAINEEHVGDVAGRPATPLHDLYHGAIDFTVSEGITYDKITVPMMRDTNHIRIVLQHLDYTPVDDKDFTFEIVDDNTLFDHANNVIPSGAVTYTPWSTGTQSTGIAPAWDSALPSVKLKQVHESAQDVQVAYAELSVSRLMAPSTFSWTDLDSKPQIGPRLRITAKEDGKIVADLPLVNYLLLLKSDSFAKMDSQEWLDRASRYNLIFFLDKNNSWIRMNIVVDDWTVRINNINLEH